MEIWDLYDKNRIPTGKTVVRGEKFSPELYRVVVHAAIINSKNQMLIQKRQSFKHGWSGLWDISVGGHVLSGETSAEGIRREIQEELGLQLDLTEKRPSFTINFPSGFDDYYIIAKDVELSGLTLQYEEVEAVKWASREEIITMIEDGSFIPYRHSLIQMLFEMKDHMGAHSQ